MNIINNILRVLQEERGFTPHKTPPRNIKNILDKIELFEMYPKIYALVIKDDKLRARVFMRYQEFYESDSDSLEVKVLSGKTTLSFIKKKQKKIISLIMKIGRVIISRVLLLNLVSQKSLTLISMI